MNDIYILGGSQTDFSRNFTKEGKNVITLIKEVIDDSFKNTGLTYKEITKLNKDNKVAIFMGNFIGEYYINQSHLGPLMTKVNKAFYGVPITRLEAACASGSAAIDMAYTKIKSNDYDLCIVIGWELMKTVDSKTGSDYLGRAALYDVEAKGKELPFAKLFDKLACETVKKYNLDKERYLKNLATISNINYQNAKRNPNAQTRNWFMSEEQANTRGIETNELVGKMLAVLDCSQITDGAACIVLASNNYLKNKKLKEEDYPIIKGYGHRIAPYELKDKIKESKNNDYLLPWTRQTIMDCYKRANMTIDDIDVIETHDCFTSSEYLAISAFGITKPGEEYKAIEDGIIDFNGSIPINPSGGLIGCGHPVGATGVRMMLDLYKQVTNKAGCYQISNVKNGMMLNIGGSVTTNYAFIVGKKDKEF